MSRTLSLSTGRNTPETDTGTTLNEGSPMGDDDSDSWEHFLRNCKASKSRRSIRTVPKTEKIEIPTSTQDPRFKGSVPVRDKTFILTDTDFKYALTLLNGQLQFVKYDPDDQHKPWTGCWLWKCVEKDGWLGFRNVASGTYLGHNGKGVFHAVQKHHKRWEWFCARHDAEERGYVLLTGLWETLAKVGIEGEGELATVRMVTDGEPMVWKFVTA
ncbi:hypothetical protein QBC38DRAFT_492923 [Podospora fimiseda]|uniref:Uncharacterized protein n=1 Tax=Podospora fimiseda TaxID=252190 RepID=A0AAN6YKZ7_9PEZI|nr:hypothetical protein QBC38DRAFT_492923 [Podospora fimiseda]